METALYESEQFAANCSVRLRQTLQETGPADAGIGAKFILSLRFSLPTDCRNSRNGVQADLRLTRHLSLCFLYRTLDFTHNLKKDRKE